MREFGVVVFFAVLTVGSPGARAQGRRLDERPTRGVLVFGGSLLGPPEAWCGETLPAGLGFIDRWSLTLHHTEMDPGGSRGGTGDAVFWAQKIPWLPLVYGVSGQFMRWPNPFSAGYGDVGKLGGSLAWRVRHWASVALSVAHFFGPGSQGLDGMTTWDLSALLRPWPSFAAGVRVSDVFMPRWWGGLPLQRTWDLEVGWRPLGTSRLTLSVGARLGERRLTVDPRVGMEWRLWRGLVLRGDVEYRHREMPMQGGGGETLQNDLNATVSLAVNFSRWGFGLGAVVGRDLTGLPGGVFGGAGAWVRVSGARTRSVHRGGAQAVVLKVPPKSSSERAFLAFIRAGHRLLRRASVAAVVVSIPDEGTGWGRAQEVRSLVQKLRKKGKKVVAMLRTPGNVAYYIAAAADEVWLFPSGGLMISGLSLTRLYFKKLLQRVGVEVQWVKHGAYKTAPETFQKEGPSPQAKEVNELLLKETYETWIRGVAKRAKLGGEAGLKRKMKRAPFTPSESRKWGFVDDTVHEDQAPGKLQRLVGKSVELVTPKKRRLRRHAWGRRDAVAVVLVEGDIVSGRSQRIPFLDRVTAGDETLLRVFKALRAEDRVKAVVVRINSPGGSSDASERLWRELRQLGKVKPVVASMGNVAASGGYEIAAAAETIFALPATLTGSIGIFAGKPNVRGLLKKLGVNIHRWTKGPFAGLKSPYVAYTEAQRKRLSKKLHEHYMRFVKAVAKSREKLSMAQVEKVARGRVWNGAQAKNRGLVDRFGGVAEALAWAKRKAGLPKDAPVLVFPRERRGWLALLAREFLGAKKKGKRSARLSVLSPVRQLVDSVPPSFLFASKDPFFARLPFELRLE